MNTPKRVRSNQLKALVLLVFAVALMVGVPWQHPFSKGSAVPAANAEQTALFMGLKRVAPTQMQKLFPESTGKPILIEFHSRLCHDCKKMAPVLAKILPKHPNLGFYKFELQEDAKRFGAVFKAFKPVSVPILVFVDSQGVIRNVLYNYQNEETITQSITQLEKIHKKTAVQKPHD